MLPRGLGLSSLFGAGLGGQKEVRDCCRGTGTPVIVSVPRCSSCQYSQGSASFVSIIVDGFYSYP